VPIHIPAITRRQMLKHSAAWGAAMLASAWLPRRAWTMPPDARPHPEHWAILSDTHVAENLREVNTGVTMADNARQATEQIATCGDRLAGVLFCGDCAYHTGESGDYKTFAKIVVDPLRRANRPIHITMGNHDHREHFLEGLAGVSAPGPVEKRFASIVPGRYADWFILDSLRHTGETPGEIGEAQLKWLDRSLAAAGPKPVIVMAHHPIERVPLPKLNGLADSRELWKILTSHRQVKAYVFGHSHRWLIEQAEGIHLINVPTTAYLFRKGEPRAWTQFALSETGLHITLHKVGDGEDLPAEKMVADLSWDASSSIIPPKRPVAEHGGG